MSESTVSILDGSTFLVCSLNGDIDAEPNQPHGLFFQDTRHLSRWKLRLNGTALDILTTDTLEYYFAQFFCVPPLADIYKNPTLSVIRRRCIGDGLVEDVTVINHSTTLQDVELELEAAADFADLFEVKDFLPKKGEYHQRSENGKLVLSYERGDFVRETIIAASVVPTEIRQGKAVFRATLQPKAQKTIQFQVKPTVGNVVHEPKFVSQSSPAAKRLRESLQQWIADAPHVTAYPDHVRMLYTRSLVDIAALRFYSDNSPSEALPAAGLPWFMALFGRDSLITSYQLLPFVPSLASAALRILSASQGKTIDHFRDEEPGKILHEVRFGELTHFKERPQSPYYGTADATPLFLVLLDEYERWTGDSALVNELKPNALAALDWIDRYGDFDQDGFVEYERKADTGLENQCWKDSWNSILFSDGSLAPAPRATCEIQGYVYDAKLRCARLARTVWNDEALGERLETSAAALKRKFNSEFWIEDRQFYALALDRDKRKVDSLTSNIGHLLWSGIVDENKAEALANHLTSPAMFSGWGVRTMAMGEAGYNPIEYHNGTVWPHDTSIIAAGLRRYGFAAQASQLIAAMFSTAPYFNYRLPEAFAGYDRDETGFPVRYPTASSPQAWAAGAAMLGLRVLLGMEPKGNSLESHPFLPEWMGMLSVEGIPGRWGRQDITAEREGAPSYAQLISRMLERRSRIKAA